MSVGNSIFPSERPPVLFFVPSVPSALRFGSTQSLAGCLLNKAWGFGDVVVRGLAACEDWRSLGAMQRGQKGAHVSCGLVPPLLRCGMLVSARVASPAFDSGAQCFIIGLAPHATQAFLSGLSRPAGVARFRLTVSLMLDLQGDGDLIPRDRVVDRS